MRIHQKRLLLSALAGVALLSQDIRAQFVPPQAQGNQAAVLPGSRTQAYGGGFAAPSGYSPPPPVNYGGGYYNPYYNPYGGYLQGVASVTSANGQFEISNQQARITQAQADMARLDVRRRLKEEADYDRRMMPNPEQVRLSDMRASLARSRANPPTGDIWSGLALNDFLAFAQTMHRQGLYGPVVPLTPDMLQNISVTSGTTQGSTGSFNNGKPLKWTVTLKTNTFEPEREKFQSLIDDLLKQTASSQGPDNDTLLAAKNTLGNLEDKLRASVADLTPDEYTGSKRFLTQLHLGLKALEDPNAGNYVSKKWAARGNSVAELIDELTRSGLKFAPAARGSEPAYTVLYSAMATYDDGLQRLLPPGPTAQAPPRQR